VHSKAARTFAQTVRDRFTGRPDSEHEQAFLRLAIGIALGIYYWYFTLFSASAIAPQDRITAVVMVAFLTCSALLIVAIGMHPGISWERRTFSVVIDTSAITYFICVAPEYAAPLYFLYLWVIFGHGFRFGKRYLFLALTLSFIGFGLSIFTTEFWESQRTMGIGLWLGMLVVSLYVSSLIKRLTDALEDADKANQAKRRFLSTVSHEMRTPLNAIIGMSDLLGMADLKSEHKEMVQTAGTASRMLLSLIESVLDFSKIEAGKIIAEHTTFALDDLIKSTIDLFRHPAEEKGLTLTLDMNSKVPCRLIGDPHHLRQVLTNLLANALKFTEQGGVTVRIKTVNSDEHSAMLRLEVIDTGIGIAPEHHSRIFESFAQADESTTRRYGGTGLGTAISKQLVELMGGTIGLTSLPGEGSTFWVELPFAKPVGVADLPSEDQVPSHSMDVQRHYHLPPTRTLSVLIADDNTINQAVLKKILTIRGHECVLVSDGDQALDAMVEQEFDVVILDINMPKINGIEATKAYNFMTTYETRAPIIIFSADVTKEVIDECLAAGADRFLPKPIDMKSLLEAVETLAAEFDVRRGKGSPIKRGELSAPLNVIDNKGDELLNKKELADLKELCADEHFIIELVASFKRDTAPKMTSVDHALLRQNMEELHDLFHSIRSAGVSIGATALTKICHALENKPRADIIADGLVGLNSLKKTYYATCNALDEHLAQRISNPSCNQPMD
jgi:two-component system sensor histidine kinase RpfC